jgi:hypothetical protein
MIQKGFVAALFVLISTSAICSGIENCSVTLELDELYNIKAKLYNSEFKYSYTENGSNFVGSRRNQVYKSFFLQCFKFQLEKTNLNELSSKDLHKLFNIMVHVNFYNQEKLLRLYLKKIISIKKSKGEIISNLLEMLHSAYIRSRSIQEAKQLESEYPDLNLPKTYSLLVKRQADRSYLELNNEEQSLVSHGFEFKKGGYVIVISSPVCSPSKRFLKWLRTSENSKLQKIFESNALFITPTDSSFYIEQMREENLKNAPLKLNYAFNKEEWPEIQLWATPTLYFFYDGKLLGQLVGWPKEGRNEELVDGLKKVKLL